MHISRRLIIGSTVGLTTLFSVALLASANSTNLSFDPSYASGPFLFYCAPYLNTFQEGGHYVPGNTVKCIFSLPNSVPGSKAIAVYRGVPGNSTLLSVEALSGSPTLAQIDSVSFGAPAQDQDYFAAVYGAGAAPEFATYFQTGSSTNATTTPGAYQLMRWKWGSKPAGEYDPVVIIPDMFDSFKKDTGASVIDPIFNTYNNLISTLVANGYVSDQTLFTFPYDWEASNASTSAALATKIASIKTTCGCSRVDIVAFGTGGLVAEHYIESASYAEDVDQLVFAGTPLMGTPNAYRAWEGGQINFGNPLADGLTQVLLNAEAKEAGYPTTFAYIQGKPVSSIKEALPTYDYLFNPNELVYPTGYPRNTFIENLINNFGTKVLNKIPLYVLLADNGLNQTTYGFQIGPSSVPPLWPEGQPTSIIPDAGDGFLPRASIENFYGSPDQQYAVNHKDLADASQSDVFTFLNLRSPSPVVNTVHPTSCVLFISTSATTNMLVTDPVGARLGKNLSGSGEYNEISRSFYSGPNTPAEYVAIANPLSGSYQVQTQGTASGSFTINASGVCGSGVISTSTTATTGPGQLIGYGVNVSTSTQTLEIQSLDNNPPVVTITSPQNNTTYLTTQNVPITAIINDPEGSPLATVSYKVNGIAVNPGLPLATSTLGTSTLVVAATDIFGHTGYATSTFAFKNPLPTIVSASADTYLRGIASDTNEGSSTLLRIQGAGDNRIVVKFNQQALVAAVANRPLKKAVLELTIQGTRPNWGNDGREVVVNRLLMNWTEGNGKNAEYPLLQMVRGTGSGATWNCATDTNITNTVPNCASSDDWNMRLLQKLQNLSLPWVAASTDGLFVQNNQQGAIDFDVTADVQAFLSGTNNYGWIVRKSLQNRPGYITFDSREVGSTGPRLILTF